MDDIVVFKHLSKISPSAAAYAKEHGFREIFSISSDPNAGVAVAVETDGLGIIYASFDPVVPPQAVRAVKAALKDLIDDERFSQKCFNCNGSNQILIQIARDMGFATDMEGYHMQYAGVKNYPQKPDQLLRQVYQTDQLDAFVRLFSQSYRDLAVENGWNSEYYLQNSKQFGLFLSRKAEQDEVWGFFQSAILVGACICEGNYIRDLVVDPLYQRQGVGSRILADMMARFQSKGIDPVRLRVARSNSKAFTFYEKNGFVPISHFAEHTFKPDLHPDRR